MSERLKIGDSCNFRARESTGHITQKSGLIKNGAAVKMTRNLEKVQSEIILSGRYIDSKSFIELHRFFFKDCICVDSDARNHLYNFNY